MTFRLVVVPLRGPGQSPVLPFAYCVGLLHSVGRSSTPAGVVSAFAEPSGWCAGAVLVVVGCAACAAAPCVTFRLVVAPLRGPGRSPVRPFACCVGSLLSVGRCGRCSCWCRFRVRGAQYLVCWDCAPPPPKKNRSQRRAQRMREGCRSEKIPDMELVTWNFRDVVAPPSATGDGSGGGRAFREGGTTERRGGTPSAADKLGRGGLTRASAGPTDVWDEASPVGRAVQRGALLCGRVVSRIPPPEAGHGAVAPATALHRAPRLLWTVCPEGGSVVLRWCGSAIPGPADRGARPGAVCCAADGGVPRCTGTATRKWSLP